jgi:hypothetical protein
MKVEAIAGGSALCSWSGDDGEPKTATFYLSDLLPCLSRDADGDGP